MLFAALRVESDTMGDFCILARANRVIDRHRHVVNRCHVDVHLSRRHTAAGIVDRKVERGQRRPAAVSRRGVDQRIELGR